MGFNKGMKKKKNSRGHKLQGFVKLVMGWYFFKRPLASQTRH